MTSQLASFQFQNLSLVQNLFSGFGKIKKGSWNFFGKLVVQPVLRQLLLPLIGERQLYLLAAAFESPKSRKQSKVSYCSLFSRQNPLPNSKIFSYLLGSLSDFNLFGPNKNKFG